MKKIFSFILSICICATVFSTALSASAAVVKKGVITIASTAANTGDEISVPIEISENPGIMAITISVTYDSSALEYIEFLKGMVLKDYTVVDHPNKNLIRFVSCESTDKKRNGALITLRFKVKDNAEWGFSKIDIKYSQGDFCNWNLDKIMPTVVSGGVDIAYNGNNCSHKDYGEWKTVAVPTCASEGIKERTCKKCNHVDSMKIAKVGHEYPEEWTVETAATKDKPGTMVRYCITCKSFVDRIEYTVEDSEEGGFNNQIGTEISKNEIIEDNFKEQNPDKEFTPVKPPLTSNSDSSGKTDSSQQSEPDSENSPTISDIIDGILDSDDSENNKTDNEETSVNFERIKAKLTEVFPNFEVIEESFKTAFIILILLILL